MSVSNGYHRVRLSSIADELDEIDPRVRGQLVAPAAGEPTPKAETRQRSAMRDVDDVDRGPANAHGLEWKEEKRALKLQGKQRCSRCRAVKPLAAFNRPMSWCRKCAATYARDRHRAKANGTVAVTAGKPKRIGVVAHPAPTSKNVLQMIGRLRGVVDERDQLKSQVDRLRKERDQAVAELNQLLSDVANAIR